jgi:RHS repeat-associated protein
MGTDRIIYGLGPIYAVAAGVTSTFARDGAKSVRAELSGTGAVVATFRYRAYGATAQTSGAPAPTYLGYASQVLDPSGLYYMRARWYDPASARFLTRDPMATGATNEYGYAAGNPVRNSDPTGLWAVDDPDLPYWRLAELRVEARLRAQYPEAEYTILYNRAMRDPETHQALRDEEGAIRRPDYQVIRNSTKEIVHVVEVGTGSQKSLLRKLQAFEVYKKMAAALEARPTTELEFEVTPRPMTRIGGATSAISKLFIPLMIFEMLLDIRDYQNSPEGKYGNRA